MQGFSGEVKEDYVFIFDDLSKASDFCKAGMDVNQPVKEGVTPLWQALTYQNIDVAELLIKYGADLNQDDRLTGDSPLMWAISNESINFFNLLIEKGAKIDHSNYEGITPLILTIKKNSMFYAQRLIVKGADVNKEDLNGKTPLIYATIENATPIIDFLLKQGANINKPCKKGLTPLFYALKNPSLLRILINFGADINLCDMEGRNALIHALWSKNCFDTLEILLHSGIDVNQQDNDGETALTWAVRNPISNSVRLLLDSRANVNHPGYKGYTPLIYSIRNGDLKTINLLIESDANLNQMDDDGAGPFTWAMWTKANKLAKSLIQHYKRKGNDINDIELNFLYEVIKFEEIDIFKELLLAGLDAFKLDSLGNFPFLLVVRGDLIILDKILIKEKAHLEKDHHNMLLEWAKYNDHSHLVEILNGTGHQNKFVKSPQQLCEDCWLALKYAVWINDLSLAHILIEAGINVNNSRNESLLSICLRGNLENSREMLRLLIRSGSNLFSSGREPLGPVLKCLSPHQYIGEESIIKALKDSNSFQSFMTKFLKLYLTSKMTSEECIGFFSQDSHLSDKLKVIDIFNLNDIYDIIYLLYPNIKCYCKVSDRSFDGGSCSSLEVKAHRTSISSFYQCKQDTKVTCNGSPLPLKFLAFMRLPIFQNYNKSLVYLFGISDAEIDNYLYKEKDKLCTPT